MRRHRLDRLQKLAQGAAVISLGVMAAGCQDKSGSPKPEEPIHANATATPNPDMMPHVNATAMPMPSASAAPSAVPSAASSAKIGAPHTINASPQPSSSLLK